MTARRPIMAPPIAPVLAPVLAALLALALVLAAGPTVAEPANPLPPGGGRPEAFDVSAGTSFAVSASPDGKWLALDLQGSLWVMPAGGGRAVRITDYFSDAHHPAWSPDSARIVFSAYRADDYDLWTVKPDGSDLRQLTHDPADDREPSWSPDGRTIAFASDRSGSYDIWTIAPDGGDLHQITAGIREDRAPAWSADGRTLVFGGSEQGASTIQSAPAEGGATTLRVAAAAGARIDAPSLGPAGELAYVRADASGSSLVIGEQPVSGSENVFPFAASWIGASAFYVADGHIRRREGTSATTVPFLAQLAVTRPNYVRAKRDFSSSAPRRVLGIQHPALSPDGRQIAFVALGDLFVVPTRGGKPRALTHDAALEADVAWSPDGKFLAYTSDRGGGLPQLWLRDLGAGTDRQLTSGPNQPLAATWSPDGTRIAYLDTDGLWGSAALQVLDVANGAIRRLGDSLPQPGKPTWSPDGKLIALARSKPLSRSFREGINAIWVIASDGSGGGTWQAPADLPTLDTAGGGGPAWSPDGRHMAAIQDGVLKVWPVGRDGTARGPARTLTAEISHYPSWSANSRTILFQAGDRLKLVNLSSGAIRAVPLDFTYRLDMPRSRLVIHVGALVDAVTDTTRPASDIVITGNRITAILAHDPAHYAGADQVIEAPELTAIPGLIDHHTHPQRDFGANLFRAWLAYGITTVRDPGDQPYDGIEFREAAEAGVRPSPRIFTTGPLLEWHRVYYRMGVAVGGPAHLERELERARALHYDLIKSYVRMPDLRQRRIVEAAHAMGVPVATHEIFPAAYVGADATEHLGASSRRGFSPKQGPQGRAYADVIQLFGRSGRVLTPTNFGALPAFLARNPVYRNDPRLAFYPDWARQSVAHAGSLPPAMAVLETGERAAIRAFHDAGALVVAGTDTMLAPCLPAEVASYVDAGLTPFEALKTATANAARALNLDAGTLEPGKLADIALIEGDPRADIGALFRTRQVIVNGRPHTVEELLATARPAPH